MSFSSRKLNVPQNQKYYFKPRNSGLFTAITGICFILAEKWFTAFHKRCNCKLKALLLMKSPKALAAASQRTYYRNLKLYFTLIKDSFYHLL